jgi:hypothetical protein
MAMAAGAEVIGSDPGACFGADEIWATKAPRTTTRKVTTKRSFQPRPLPTVRWRELLAWVVMASSVRRQG